MRGTILPSSPSRIKGRASLVRRLRALLVASHRFGRHRAVTRDEVQFAAQLVDGLTATLATVAPLTPRPVADGQPCASEGPARFA
jgi:hypothetical protein